VNRRNRVIRTRLAAACAAFVMLASAICGAAGPRVLAAAGGYVALEPTRILDTRDGLGAPSQPIGPGQTIDVTVTGLADVPSAGAGAVLLNLTGTQPTANTFLTVYPTGSSRPDASNLNLLAGQTDANLVIATVGHDGKIS